MTHTTRNGAAWLALGITAVLLTGCGPTTGVGEAKAKTSAVAESPGSATVTAPAGETTDDTTEADTPAAGPADFGLGVKILTQECFGSAGCNITYRVQVNRAPTTGTYEVTYEVAVPGDDNSPYTDTLTVTDGKYETPFEGMGSPAHRVKASKIKVKVTAVQAQ